MAIPMIRAIQSLPDTTVDILVGCMPDDFGAHQVLSKVVSGQGKLYTTVALEHTYDVAVMAIPFDGRWHNGIHFNAKTVLDGRTRPDPSTTGLISWKKHEVEYQMDNAYELGFYGQTPSMNFLGEPRVDPEKVYVGVGYKKDAAGFWKVKHWGNENYATLIKMLLDSNPRIRVVATGDAADLQLSIAPISRMVSDKRFEFKLSARSNLDEAFYTVTGCGTYVGNDTGMMHVAAAHDRKVVGLFFMEHAYEKNRPWSFSSGNSFVFESLSGHDKITPQMVLEETLAKVKSCTS